MTKTITDDETGQLIEGAPPIYVVRNDTGTIHEFAGVNSFKAWAAKLAAEQT